MVGFKHFCWNFHHRFCWVFSWSNLTTAHIFWQMGWWSNHQQNKWFGEYMVIWWINDPSNLGMISASTLWYWGDLARDDGLVSLLLHGEPKEPQNPQNHRVVLAIWLKHISLHVQIPSINAWNHHSSVRGTYKIRQYQSCCYHIVLILQFSKKITPVNQSIAIPQEQCMVYFYHYCTHM